MDELVSAAATIHGAQIQANYTLWAAVLGGIFLLGSIWLTVKSTLQAHKADKLAEAKRDVCLELVQNWYNFLSTLNSYQSIEEKEAYNANYQDTLTKLLSSLHKSSFISDPKTKELILDFTMDLTKSNFKIMELINNWYAIEIDQAHKVNVIFELMDIANLIGLRAMELQISLRKELGLNDDDVINQRILKKQKDFAEDVKKMLRKLYGLQ
jgi:hypothetical protein